MSRSRLLDKSKSGTYSFHKILNTSNQHEDFNQTAPHHHFPSDDLQNQDRNYYLQGRQSLASNMQSAFNNMDKVFSPNKSVRQSLLTARDRCKYFRITERAVPRRQRAREAQLGRRLAEQVFEG